MLVLVGAYLTGACGCLWLPVAACGCVWLPVAACGCLWLPVAACGCVWLPVVACGVRGVRGVRVGACLSVRVGGCVCADGAQEGSRGGLVLLELGALVARERRAEGVRADRGAHAQAGHGHQQGTTTRDPTRDLHVTRTRAWPSTRCDDT
eukprot:1156367-Prymnesium_polylepis.1